MSISSSHRLHHFVHQQESLWKRLEELLTQAEKKRVAKAELDELGSSYRKVAAQLAYAQTYFPDHEVTHYLNDLVVRSHNTVYATKKKGDMRLIYSFLRDQFPERLYERLPFIFIASFIFFCGAGFAYLFTLANADNVAAFLPAEILAQIDPSRVGEGSWNGTVVSGQIMLNNIRVALFCFALGALFGVGTIWMLWLNGVLIGALAALFQQAGQSYAFWAFILPHGVIELFAIFIAGGAGLSLAYSFFVPKERTRLHAFKEEGLITIQLVLGVIPLFIIAGLIEGYITPLPWPHWSKYGVALITLLFLTLYIGRVAWKRGKVKASLDS
ncbi:stage II sporulation protein M [Mechercharimyces sp. CAU 1602]|uniref:stage II sporulation protein M n=1 Tax=Mechercharimyces sp. CAU 1602 TaxID=2973933 RepID=UPI002163EB5E|nr:stage II sporulation protein M [Mechercharimyces sp. CAU 1602]MCS1351104.1 stage II sporulation protein M [Mechercharimyces sp. CAU 1602]